MSSRPDGNEQGSEGADTSVTNNLVFNVTTRGADVNPQEIGKAVKDVLNDLYKENKEQLD